MRVRNCLQITLRCGVVFDLNAPFPKRLLDRKLDSKLGVLHPKFALLFSLPNPFNINTCVAKCRPWTNGYIRQKSSYTPTPTINAPCILCEHRPHRPRESNPPIIYIRIQQRASSASSCARFAKTSRLYTHENSSRHAQSHKTGVRSAICTRVNACSSMQTIWAIACTSIAVDHQKRARAAERAHITTDCLRVRVCVYNVHARNKKISGRRCEVHPRVLC